MIDRQKLYDGIGKCAWGYIFLYFDINLGTVSILPDFIAFANFLGAIELLEAEERELSLLRPLGKLLMLWHLAQWGASWFGTDLDGLIPVLDIIICLANLYFHFQLLTNLAAIASRYQTEEEPFDNKLLKYRTRQTVLFTVMMVLSYLSDFLGDAWGYIAVALVIAYLIVGLCMMGVLFDFRKLFRTNTLS